MSFDTNGNNTTTQSPTATTVAETARTTATETQIPTATESPPSVPDTWPTETATEQATEAMEPGLGTRETYTNDRYVYTIEYPTGWRIDAADSSAVTISSNVGVLRIEMMEDIPSSLTAEEIAPVFLEGYKESIEEEGGSVEETGRGNATLPNGHNSKVVDLRMEQATNVFQQKILLTVVNGIGYVAVIMVPDVIYTSDVEANMDEILLTLTISESSVQTEAPGVPV